MNRFLLPLTLLLAAAAVWADSSPAPSAQEKAEHFQNNHALVKDLVKGSLRLAAVEGPVDRAKECSDIAKSLANEIRQAATANKGYRAAELGGHLRELLEDGIAKNLEAFRKQASVNSPGIQQMNEVKKSVADITGPLERQFRMSNDTNIREAVQAILMGRYEVEKAMQGLPTNVEKEAPSEQKVPK
jgi:hypothetical protein